MVLATVPIVPAQPIQKAPEAPVVVDPYAGQPPHVKLAVDASGGLDSGTGKNVYRSLTGKDVPASVPIRVIDPFENQPPHVKLAVDASGGITSPDGAKVYKALTGKDYDTGAPVPAKRGRPAGKKADIPTPQPAAAPVPTIAPATPAPSFAKPPTASAGGLGSDLDALLANAMNTPTGAK
jgi:hypothetical protein